VKLNNIDRSMRVQSIIYRAVSKRVELYSFLFWPVPHWRAGDVIKDRITNRRTRSE